MKEILNKQLFNLLITRETLMNNNQLWLFKSDSTLLYLICSKCRSGLSTAQSAPPLVYKYLPQQGDTRVTTSHNRRNSVWKCTEQHGLMFGFAWKLIVDRNRNLQMREMDICVWNWCKCCGELCKLLTHTALLYPYAVLGIVALHSRPQRLVKWLMLSQTPLAVFLPLSGSNPCTNVGQGPH